MQINSIALADSDGGSVTFDRMGLVENVEYESGIRLFQSSCYLGCVLMTGDRFREPPDGSTIEREPALPCVAFYGMILRINVDSDPAHDSSLLFEECDYRFEDDNQCLETKPSDYRCEDDNQCLETKPSAS